MEVVYMIWIAVGLFIVLSLLFKRYFGALIYDYVVDFGLSTLDNFLMGAGTLGLDIGDWAAAVLIFKKEKKISYMFIAFLAAWEATNLLPLSFIPIFGELLEVILNLCPTVFILRLIFSRYGQADKAEKRFKKNIDVAKDAGIKIKKFQDYLHEIHHLIEKENPVGALKEEARDEKELHRLMKEYVEKLISEAVEIINKIVSTRPEGPDEIIEMLQEGIRKSEELLDEAKRALSNNDYETAVKEAHNAKQILIESINYCSSMIDKQAA